MYEHPLEELHRLLDTVDRAIERLSTEQRRSVPVDEFPELSEVVLELLGWTNTAYVENKLSINPALLSKFVKMRGKAPIHIVREMADRLRSFLKSEDQSFSPGPRAAQQSTKNLPPALPFTVAAEQWVAVKISSEQKMKIGAIASLLDSIIEQTSRANAPHDQQLLSEIERQQLISVLETALNVLKSPLLERGILRRARSALKNGAESAAERGVQQGLGKLMEAAGARIAELIVGLFT